MTKANSLSVLISNVKAVKMDLGAKKKTEVKYQQALVIDHMYLFPVSSSGLAWSHSCVCVVVCELGRVYFGWILLVFLCLASSALPHLSLSSGVGLDLSTVVER